MSVGVRNAPLSYYDLSTSPDIVIQQAEQRAWDYTKDKAPLVALLNMLPKAGPWGSKKLNFGIGDYFTDVLTLSGAIADITATTEITFAAGNDFLMDGDIVHIYQGVTTGGATIHNYAFIRILARISANKYRFEIVVNNGVRFQTTATVRISTSAVPIHGDARQYLNKKGDVGVNWMQRSRDTVGKSDFENEMTLIDSSLETLVRSGFDFYAQKWSRALHTNVVGRGGKNESDEWGMTGGIPFFLNPGDVSTAPTNGIYYSSNSSYAGQNKVVNASSLSFNDLIKWMRKLTEYGGKDKIILLPDDMYELWYDLIRSNVALTRTDLRSLSLDLPYVWEANSVNLGFGNAHLVRDTTMNDAFVHIKDDVNAALIATPGKHMVALDPKFIKLRPFKNAAGRVMNMQMTSIQRINNGSVDKMEFDGMVGLEISEPRACGYFGLQI